ncbi:acyltransferase family protein [Janthinobacterium sp. DSP2-3-3]|uniref:acyltransferase family protein n=1 Tax=Janthinobacterium sp. DSP2-3-3 TaxID=2804596 RepID=UPI003CF5B050
MGLIRFFLAISVIFSHLNIVGVFTGGGIAVQSFYIISGFFVALMFDVSPAYGNISKFYRSRLLRIFPIYYVVFLISVVFVIVFGIPGLPNGKELFLNFNIETKFLIVFSNIFIFFQDWIMFLGWNNGALSFVSHFSMSEPPLYNFLLVPQAWSLAIELSFYLISPFLVRCKTNWLVFLVVVGLLLRVIFYKNGLFEDPWSYRFFGLELFTFLIGMLSYRMYRKAKDKKWNIINNKKIGASSLIFMLTFAISLKSLPVPVKMLAPFFYLSVFVLLPIIFNFTKSNKLDRFIGELSYPLYVVHILVINMANFIFGDSINTSYYSIFVLLISVLASIILNLMIQNKIDNYRSKIKVL